MNINKFDKRILPLAMGGLGIGMTEFAIMGILPDIAKSLNVSIPLAGHFIAAYAVGVVIGAPLIISYASKFPPKKVLMVLMILFATFNAISAIANSYEFMLISRFLSGLPHGAFFGVATVVATRLAEKGKEAWYISMSFTGLTIANLIMVPIGTYVGHTFHWSWCFIIVSIIGLITVLLLKTMLPAMSVETAPNGSGKLDFLKKAETWHVLVITGIGFGGLFAWLSYITPLMTEVSKIESSSVAYVMILAGAGMVVGNIFGGYLTDRLGMGQAGIALLFLMMISLLGVFFLSGYQPVSLVLTFLCGALSMSLIAPVNLMMLKAAPDAKMMSAAFMQAAFNIANALGAYLGGIPLSLGFSFSYPSLVGVSMSLFGLMVFLRYYKKYTTSKNFSYI